jgi:hypothetical protein
VGQEHQPEVKETHVNECILCGTPGSYPYCGPACEAADNPDEK